MGIQSEIQTDTDGQATADGASAQAALYNTFSKAMFNICIRMAGNRAQAEDFLHDAFILAFKSMAQIKQPEATAGWLRRIVVNECIRQGKRAIRWSERENGHDMVEEDNTVWWEAVSLELLHREIKSLPDGCRQVFVLYALENFSHKEIASSLGISEGTSKSQYHRSRTLLKERLIKQMKLVNG